MPGYSFKPRWKEELVCTSDKGKLVFEMTMGVATVYFPTAEPWQQKAPDWAKAQYGEILAALRAWCEQQRIPLVVDDNAWVAAEP